MMSSFSTNKQLAEMLVPRTVNSLPQAEDELSPLVDLRTYIEENMFTDPEIWHHC